MALLQAQVQNETAKGQENAVDVQLKTAKTATEKAKARGLESGADLTDLDFVDKESGNKDTREAAASDKKHAQNLENKEFDRQVNLDNRQLDAEINVDNAGIDR